MIRNARFVTLAVCTFALAFAQNQAQAQVKPLKITGGGLAPEGIQLIPGTPGPHWAVGTATELGKYYGEGFFQILDYTSPLTADPVTAEFSSAPEFVFTAANGDKLAMTYGVVGNGAQGPGQVTLYPAADGSFTAVFVAEFNPVPADSTGRFAKVTEGSLIMIAISEPFFITGATTTPFEYTWSGEGTLTFKK
jgi:hypothetical protein